MITKEVCVGGAASLLFLLGITRGAPPYFCPRPGQFPSILLQAKRPERCLDEVSFSRATSGSNGCEKGASQINSFNRMFPSVFFRSKFSNPPQHRRRNEFFCVMTTTCGGSAAHR